MTLRPKAGDNERKFELLFQSRVQETQLLGKRRFTSGDVEISVDQSFEHEGTEFLVEIDSANMAKLLVGQYVLLNQLHTARQKAFFLVIHAYRNYNPIRTTDNLQFINKQLYDCKGIPFGAVHIETLANWAGGIPGLIKLLTSP